MFDLGQEGIINDLDLSQLKRSGHGQQHIDIDFPVWMIEALDREAMRLEVGRQSIYLTSGWDNAIKVTDQSIPAQSRLLLLLRMKT
jgi:hypothetical protein